MGKNKQDYLNELAKIAFKIDDKANRMHERTKRLQRMASLAKQGLKQSEEYKLLELEFSHPTVTDFGNEVSELQRVVKQLRKYKFD